MSRTIALACLAAFAVGATTSRAAETPAAAASPEGVEFFEKHVRPILVDTCYKCHSAQSEKLKGGLYVDSRDGLLKGGKAGPSIVPGDPDKSLLIKAVRYADEDLQMPPKTPLSKEQVALLEAWVKMGAPDPRTSGGAPKGEPTVLSLADAKHFWSFKKPIPTPIPSTWTGNRIDYFVTQKLQANGLQMAPPADKRSLIRRAALDLTGLPPTAEEVAAFEADASPDAFEKVLDRLLASPAYGQRWARHWLDLARYADTKGYVFQEERRYPYAYTYRDWVINALNADMPYDQFLIHQIAADRVVAKDPKADTRNLAAMGFLTLGRRFLNSQPDIIDDRLDVITRGTMALTVACARCHDHKFDPIPTADYYSLYGVFASSTEPKGAALPLLDNGPGGPQRVEYEKELATREAAVQKFKQDRLEKALTPLKTAKSIESYLLASANPGGRDAALNRFALRRWRNFLEGAAASKDPAFAPWFKLAALPEKEFAAKAAETLRPFLADPKTPAALAKALTAKPLASLGDAAAAYGSFLEAEIRDPKSVIATAAAFPTNVTIANVETIFSGEDRSAYNSLLQKRDAVSATHPGAPARAMVLVDSPTPVNPVIFKRGNAGMPGAQVPRQFLAAVAGDGRQPFKEGSGRLELARAIASKDNPLTARVMVNRVWAQHFGRGLVRTPSDFGVRGERPTHPEMLDDLAVRFMNDPSTSSGQAPSTSSGQAPSTSSGQAPSTSSGQAPSTSSGQGMGWSLKKLHKTIMLSATYRQGSLASAKAMQVDADNRLLSHQNRQRLDFEALRDSVLFAAGRLDVSLGGKSVDLLAQPATRRRTVYGFIDRQNLPNTFRSFDFASPDQHAPMRFANTVPQQALFMMNSPFVVEQARALANRVAEATPPADRVRGMYRAALSREPSREEIELALGFVSAEAPAPSLAVSPRNPWQYGYGAYESASPRTINFAPLPHFTGSAYQGGPSLPDGRLGYCLLTPQGGHAGNHAGHAVIRRWTAPRDGAVTITGTVTHGSANGDGVRGRIVSSRTGELAALTVHNRATQTQLDAVEVKAGDTIDFVVDCRNHPDFDSFTWPVTLKMKNIPEGIAGGQDTLEWDAQKDFAAPQAKPQQAPLNAWEKLAQVLLQTNEFVFVD